MPCAGRTSPASSPPADETDPGRHWPGQAIDALFALNTAAHEARDQGRTQILRPTKTQMKISGTFRSEASAKAWAHIRGYLSTARKNGITAFDALQRAITGNPWTPTQTATA